VSASRLGKAPEGTSENTGHRPAGRAVQGMDKRECRRAPAFCADIRRAARGRVGSAGQGA
jgi:hypothetical protein